MGRRFPLLIGLVALFVACSSSESDPLFQPSASAGSCVENQTVECACPGGKKAVQVCLATGKYGTCPCGVAGAGGSTSGGSTSGGSTSGGSTSGGSTSGGSTSGGSTSGGSTSGGSTSGGSTSGGSTSGGSTSGGSTSGGSTSGGSTSGGSTSGGAAGGGDCTAGDCDGDGYPAPLDCDDKNPRINPGAVDLPELDASGELAATQIDDDCDGAPAVGPPAGCDEGLGPIAASPTEAARAMGLCAIGAPPESAPPSERRWGVIDARWSAVSGPMLASPPPPSPLTPALDTGIVPTFGPSTTPREGTRMFALSTGVARAPGQVGAVTGNQCELGTGGTTPDTDKKTTSPSPGAFTSQVSCGQAGTPHDGVALDLRLRVPSNATSFTVNYRFFSCEFPDYTCNQYNDVFAILMAPSPFTPGDPMSPNVAFESSTPGVKRIIGVNNTTFLTACAPGTPSYTACAGDAELAGSGFEKHAASGWLRTTAPVKPGSVIDLRFAVWDSGDGLLSSTVVVDGFTWGTNPDFGTVIEPSEGQGGAGGAGGAGGDPFGGAAGTAGASGGFAGAGGGASLACTDGTCANPGECCKGIGQPCGQELSGFCF
ncbi:MAG: putative metal-binding motif-containing protein [Polyangiaceae bacterium]|nr:putative metal-binding motif-containing protein [Polyangiaceae bacterium]